VIPRRSTLPFCALSPGTTIFRNLHFSGFTGSARSACEKLGLAEMPVQNITFSDMQLPTRGGFIMTYAKRIEFHNVRVTPDNGPAITAAYTDGLGTLTPKSGTPLIDLGAAVKDVFIHDCAPPAGTDIFVRVLEAGAGEVTMEGNRLTGVKTGVLKR
jgi:hypothetical protein